MGYCVRYLILIYLLVLNTSILAEPLQKNIYRLGAGDKLNISVLNQPSLTGEYSLDGAGKFSMPFIGSISAAEMSLDELEAFIIKKLSPDYLRNPRVSIKILNYRPYYILGEVEEPGSYPYVDGMTYLNAVAIAGGYTYRANKEYIMVTRAGESEKKEFQLKLDQLVFPGDIIRIKERYF